MTAQITRFNVAAVGQPEDSVTVAYMETVVLALATGKWPPAPPASILQINRFNVAAVGQPKESQTVGYMETVVLADATAKWPPPGTVSLLQIARFNVAVVGQPKESQTVGYMETVVLADATAKWPLASFVSLLQISRFNVAVVGQPKGSGTIGYMEAAVLGKGLAPPDAIPVPLPAVLDVLRHNWIENTQITTTWSTDVVQSALRLSEERRGLVPRPYRMVEFQWTGATQGGSQRALMTLARMTEARFVMPIYTDITHVTAPSSGTVLNAPGSFRRFQAGGFLVVFEVGDDCEPLNIQVREIDVPGAAQIILTTALTGTVPVNAVVLPLIYTEIVRSGLLNLLSDHHGHVPLTVEEVSGPTALLPLASGNGGAALFEGTPVFPFAVHWGERQSVGVKRPGLTEFVGRGVSIFLRGERPAFQFVLSFRGMSRVETYQIASFFDARRGRLLPFWLASPLAPFEVVNWDVAQVDVVPRGPIQNLLDYISAFAVVLDSGQIILRRAIVVPVGDVWRIGFTTPLPAEAANYARDVERLTTAHFVRFSSDSMTEVWGTNETTDISLGAEEILVEEDIVLAVEIADPGFEVPLTETPRRADLDGQLWLTCNGANADAYLTKDGSDKVSHWADKYGTHGGISQAIGALQPTYLPGAFGGRGGVQFNGSLGQFLEGLAPLTGVPLMVMGVFEIDTETEPAVIFSLYNSGATGNFFAQTLTGTNVVVPLTTNPAMLVESNEAASSVMGGQTLGLLPDYNPGEKAYETNIPFAGLLTAFDDVNQVPFQRNIFGRIRNPTTGTNNTLFGGRGFADGTVFPNPVGVDTVRIGLSPLGGTPNSRLTVGELIFFNYQTSQASLQGTDFVTNLMFDYFAANWPIL